ncbi:MAG TPA: hypothetical protein VLL25_07625 [Acidimicrobiales bacterium]|nr:hypothetical protein [Acidimicrobiales bacterium]
MAVEPLPYIMNTPLVEINGVEIHCLLSHVELGVDQNTVDTTTFCGIQRFPGPAEWLFRATAYQSFDEGGTDEILTGALAAGGAVAYKVVPNRNLPVSATNPEFSGEAIPRLYPLITGDAGAASTIDIEWTMTAEPTRSTVAAG